MKLLPDDPRTRRELCIGALVAAMTLATAVAVDLPWIATALFPGLWVALRARPSRCPPSPAGP